MPTSRLQRYAWPAYIVVLLATAGGTLVVEVGAHAFGGHQHTGTPAHHGSPAQDTAANPDSACTNPGKTIDVTVTAAGFGSPAVTASLCDRLVVHNAATADFEVAFGPHDHHIDYPGFSEQTIAPDGTAQGILRARGTYRLHDHFDDRLQMTLVVK